nr:10318_t:CDS:2 [Entrophospora candida]
MFQEVPRVTELELSATIAAVNKAIALFKNCSEFNAKNLCLAQKIDQLSVQRSEFHSNLQKSLSLSSRLYHRAGDVFIFLETLENPEYGADDIAYTLNTLLEDARINKADAEKLTNSYENTRTKLSDIYNEIQKHNVKILLNQKLKPVKVNELREITDKSNYFSNQSITFGTLVLVFFYPGCTIPQIFVILFIVAIVAIYCAISSFLLNEKAEKLKEEIRQIDVNLYDRDENIDSLIRNVLQIVGKVSTLEIYWKEEEAMINDIIAKFQSDPTKFGLIKVVLKKRWEKVRYQCHEYNTRIHCALGREPNSSVVFHALPRHDKDLPLDAMEGKPLTKEDKWQDDEHLVHPPASNDPKGIVGRLQKDVEEEDKRINISKADLNKRQ